MGRLEENRRPMDYVIGGHSVVLDYNRKPYWMHIEGNFPLIHSYNIGHPARCGTQSMTGIRATECGLF